MTKPLHPWGENIRTDVSWLPRPDDALPPARSEAEPHEGGTATEYVLRSSHLTHAAVELHPTGTSGDPDLEAAIANRFADLFRLFKERQRKYGPGNIAKFGDRGVHVRLSDKVARLDVHYAGGAGDMPDETVDDTWSDVAVYAIIALVCRQGRWPGWAKTGGK